MPANLENSAVATGLEKVSFHSNPKERQCQRMLKHRTIALISHASKVMLKILQAKLQQYMNHDLPDVQAGFRKGRGTRSSKKQESSRKTSAATAKSLQSCPTLCDPIDGSPPGSTVPGILQARTLQ